MGISLIVAVSDSGKLGRLVSKYKPDVNILSFTSEPFAFRQQNMVKGVVSAKMPQLGEGDDACLVALDEAKTLKLTKKGAKVAFIQCLDEGTPDESNFMKIVDVIR